jgi:hypothetical protein
MEAIKERKARKSFARYTAEADMTTAVVDHIVKRLTCLLYRAEAHVTKHGLVRVDSDVDARLAMDERSRVNGHATWTNEVAVAVVKELYEGADGDPAPPEGVEVTVGGIFRVTDGDEKFTAVMIDIADELHGEEGYLLVEADG